MSASIAQSLGEILSKYSVPYGIYILDDQLFSINSVIDVESGITHKEANE